MTSTTNGTTVTFKQAELLDTDLLISHVQRNPDLLSKNIRLLRQCKSETNSVLLGINGGRRLQIVEIVKKFEGGLLYSSLTDLQWANKNIFTWMQDIDQFAVDPLLMPGIVYVVPECPTDFIETLKFINEDIPITIVKYLYLESEHEQGFFFESVAINRRTKSRVTDTLTEEQITYFKEQAGLTQEEIMAFLA